MSLIQEAGVLPQSERRFATPSAVACALFFYITRCGHYYVTPDYDFHDDSPVGRTESHRNFLLMYVSSGFMEFYNDGVTWNAESGQLSFIDCRRSHQFRALRPSELLWVHFDGSNAADFYEHFLTLHGGRGIVSLPASSSIPGDLLRIVHGLRTGEDTESERSQLLHRTLCELIVPPLDKKQGTGAVAAAIGYMNAHLFEDLSVTEVAQIANLSPAHFSRLFKSRTGYSPHEYIVLHRIDEAKVLLHTTSLSVKEIAYRVGYHSEVNFISSFTSKVGVSPAVFRRQPF